MSTDTESASTTENWLPELFRHAGLDSDSPLPLVAGEMDKLATSVAPVARTWWKWLILIQGFSATAPLLWLLRESLNISAPAAALTTLLAVLVLVGALWWVRWRGMQRTWARARLVAEVARGKLAAAVCPSPLSLHALDAVSEVRGLPAAPAPPAPVPWPQWKDAWIADRVEGQLTFFRKAMEKAEHVRRNSSRWTTLFMDVALTLALAGVIIAFGWRPIYWRAYRIEVFLGVLGAVLPLGIILLQSLRHFQELRRRTAGFAAQIAMLELAKQQLRAASSPETALQIVVSTEDKLLAEVVDWYYETETSEQFFQVREIARRAAAAPSHPALDTPWLRPVTLLLGLGGVGLLFMGRVILGRLPWVVIAVAFALTWLNYWAPKDPEIRSHLQVEANLFDEKGSPWQPTADRAEIGCVIIAHGLHDGAILAKAGEEERWMQSMAKAFDAPLAHRTPNIGLVDWEGAAQPSKVHEIAVGFENGDLIIDAAGIRPKAQEVGDFLALRLVQAMREGKIRRDRPLHLIGHSAGGFLVARAALDLAEWKVAPASMHVTILDTPEPEADIQSELPRNYPVDFYITSGFVRGLDEKAAPPNKPGLYVHKVPSTNPALSKEAHRDAYRWFTQTISAAAPGDPGFGRSPFCLRK